MEPIVSVVIPVHCASDEQEKFLASTLASVTGQTFRNFETVIVDDASPRDIKPIIDSAGELPGLRLIRNETNLRQAGARNVGVSAATGESIAFLDHDDIWLPEKLERQVEEMHRNPEAAMVFSAIRTVGGHTETKNIDQSMLPDRPDFEFFMRWGNRIVTASAVMVRKSALEEIGGFDTHYTTSDDLDAWVKISRKWPIIYLRECLVEYRIHSSNLNRSVDRLNDTRLLFPIYLDYYRRAPLRKKVILAKAMMRKVAGQMYFRAAALLAKRDSS